MPHLQRPYIICHMMSTIDGKITSGTNVGILEDYFSLYTQVEALLQPKAWMLGRVTMERFAEHSNVPLPPATTEISYEHWIKRGDSTHLLFAIDTKGVLRWKDNTISFSNVADKLHLTIVVTRETPKQYLRYLQAKGISYIVGGDSEIDFETILGVIKESFGVDKLLLEGGAILNGSLMAASLIDEISLLVIPKVANRSGAPSVFERDTPQVDIKKYSLFDIQKMEQDAVWLRYKKVP